MVTRPPSSSVSGPIEQLEAVESALQDQGRRHLVDHLGAAAAGDVGLEQRALGGRCRQPLVPQQHGQRCELRQVAREGARCLGARALGPVEADGQSDHEAAHAMLLRDLEEAPGVGRELGPRQRGEPRGDGARHVGEGEAHRLGADVEPQQARAGGQGPGELIRREDLATSLGGGRCAGHGPIMILVVAMPRLILRPLARAKRQPCQPGQGAKEAIHA